MFPFTDIAPASDQSAKQLAWLAWSLGSEGSDWVWEWRDGGRVAFSFKNPEHLETFRGMRLLLELSGWPEGGAFVFDARD